MKWGKCKILIIFFILVFLCNCVYAGENNTHYSENNIINESIERISDDKVIALEDGHFNTSFNDGSNGYCLEYGEQEASKGDVFYKVDTSYARNNLDNKKVGNYLKLFFVEYTHYALSDKVRTQHYIWHFTDGFNGWRLNYTIIDNIKNSTRLIPDFYEEDLGNGTVRCFNFNVLLSLYEHHQNYFTYKISYRNISGNNCTLEDVDDAVNNTGLNIHIEIIGCCLIDVYVLPYFKESYHKDNVSSTKIILYDNLTGLNLYSTILILIFCMTLLIIMRVSKK